MSFDLELFKSIATGAHDIITSLAIAGAAIWGVYTFRALGSVQKAKAELTALERASVEEPVLQIDLRARSKGPASEGPRTILVSAKFKNEGKRSLEFETPQLAIYQRPTHGSDRADEVRAQHDTAAFIGPGGELRIMPSRILRSAQARTIAFAVEVPAAGYYLLQLSTLYHGLVTKGGRLEKSEDVSIMATEQLAVNVR
jgi:hypothetical protein